jgi:hypothetical protein
MIAFRILWPDHKTNNIDRLAILRIKINWICQNSDDTNGARQIVMHGMGNCNAAANGGAAKTLAAHHNVKKTALAKTSELSGAFSKLFNNLLFAASSDANHNLIGGEVINYGHEKTRSVNKACAAPSTETESMHCRRGAGI